MYKRICLIFVFISLIGASCTQSIQESDIHWVTLKDIARSLENQPVMNVGFDVDDTVLFSSPGYYYGQQKFSPGSNAYILEKEFWD